MSPLSTGAVYGGLLSFIVGLLALAMDLLTGVAITQQGVGYGITATGVLGLACMVASIIPVTYGSLNALLQEVRA